MPELISELIWAPMGAQEDADMTVDHFCTPIYNGGMCATLHGMYNMTQIACTLWSWNQSATSPCQHECDNLPSPLQDCTVISYMTHPLET